MIDASTADDQRQKSFAPTAIAVVPLMVKLFNLLDFQQNEQLVQTQLSRPIVRASSTIAMQPPASAGADPAGHGAIRKLRKRRARRSPNQDAVGGARIHQNVTQITSREIGSAYACER